MGISDDLNEFIRKVESDAISAYSEPAYVDPATRLAAFKILAARRGKRYVGASLRDCENDQARTTLLEFAARMPKYLKSGQGNLLFVGPPGGGKDHLMMAMMKSAIIDHGYSVQWHDGLELYSSFKLHGFTKEPEILKNALDVQILAISDPIPPRGELNNYDLQMLRRITERRYSQMKAIWVTSNVSGKEDAKVMFTSAVLDRMIDGATQIQCDWESYRKPRI